MSSEPARRSERVATAGGRGGRPRDPEVDERVREATLAILTTDGYAAVTMEAVARRAAVAHTTVYRRWPSKAHLVHEVLFPDTDAFTIEPGATVTDVVTGLVVGIVENIARPEARAALPGLMGEYQSAGSLAGRLADRFEPALSDAIDAFFAEAVARGEARPGLDGATLLDAILGFAVVSGFLHDDRPATERAQHLLDLILHGIVVPPA
jgi:AcrR family transcriptional regulator